MARRFEGLGKLKGGCMNSSLQEYKDLAKDVIKALKPIAEKIGQGAEEIYKMAVLDVFIDGVFCLILVVFGALLLIWAYKRRSRWTEEMKKEWISRNDSVFVFQVVLIVAGTGLFFGPMYYGLHCLLNPQYIALKDLLHSVCGRGF